MTDLDRIAAWVAAEVADKGPLMNNPNHWGVGDWERLWKHVRETAEPVIPPIFYFYPDGTWKPTPPPRIGPNT